MVAEKGAEMILEDALSQSVCQPVVADMAAAA
jgi:hypothetical protein